MSDILPVRDRLLTSATEVFASKGYSATRVSDIVGRGRGGPPLQIVLPPTGVSTGRFVGRQP